MIENNENFPSNEKPGGIDSIKLLSQESGHSGNYTPKFEEEGEAKELASSYGLGVFEQNGKFYFSSCNSGTPEEAYSIPDSLAKHIAEGINSGEEDPLTNSLWGPNREKSRKEILEKISSSLGK